MTRDPLDDLGQGDRGLIELFSYLTSEPSVSELSGEYAALRMFRTASGAAQGSTAAAPRVAAKGRRRRRPSRARLGGRLVAAASVAALAGGFAAAGYAAVLPAPLQHAAHQVFGFAGVPNSPGKSGSSGPAVPVASRRTTGGPGGSASPRPGSSGPGSHSPRSGSPSASPSSSASPSPSLVIPAITVSGVTGPHGRSEMLKVSIPLARRSDVVRLEDLVDGQWQLVRSHRLHQGETEFSVVARKISVTYRVVLPATAEHGWSVSRQVTVAAHPKGGGQGQGQGGG